MTTIAETGFSRLEAESRLLNPVWKGPTKAPQTFGFRGDLALKFAAKVADEARPPELAVQQVIAVAKAGEPTIRLFAAYLLSFEHLKEVSAILGDTLSSDGKYFAFCNNIDLRNQYRTTLNGITWYILPIDEATVYNELLELLYIERNDLKKLDTAEKLDVIADKAAAFTADYPFITFDEGLKLMGPVRNPNENRPV